jgi:site-specific DNA-methyltransferase (adenine-specific)
LIWKKNRVTGHLNANRQPLRQHELILVFGREKAAAHYTPQKTPGKPYTVTNRSTSQVYRVAKSVTTHTNTGDRHPTSVLCFDEG